MSVNTERATLQTETCLRVTGLTDLFDSNNRNRQLAKLKLEHELGGLWLVTFEFPGVSQSTGGRSRQTTTTTTTTESQFKIYINISPNTAPPFPKAYYKQLGTLRGSFSLESLDGDMQQKRSFEWNLSNPSDLAEGHCIKMMSWSALWTDNPEIQRKDGFRVVVSLSTFDPPKRPVITHPLILNNVLELMEGQDVIDTKFLVFSKRCEVDGLVGASDPLPVYANALVMRQCEYFETSQ